MKVTRTAIPDVLIIEPRVFEDQRGFLMESWQAEVFRQAGIDASFVQDSHSRSVQGTLRGLHYQIRRPQGKLVRAVRGEVFDVAVDMRRGSPTFGRWSGELISETNRRMLWIPPGFAHGFYVLSAEVDFLYKCTDYYCPEHERSVLWNDPELAIAWPIPPAQPPLLSEKDAHATPFKDAEYYQAPCAC